MTTAPTDKSSLKGFWHKHPVLCNFILIIVVIIAMGWFAMVFLDIWTVHGKTTIVPEIKNTSLAEAEQLLANTGLRIEVSDSIYDESIPPGTVIESWPKVGAVVKPGREVYVTISSFTPRKVQLDMPLRDVSSRQAISYLESLGISNIRLVSVPSHYDDLVEGATYNGCEISVGARLPINAVVTLRVGSLLRQMEIDSVEVSRQIELDQAVDEAIGQSSDNPDSDPYGVYE